MRTAEEVISIIQELSIEERKKITDYLVANEEEFIEENYSLENMAMLDRIQAEAENGINVSPRLKGEEANLYLRNLRKSRNE